MVPGKQEVSSFNISYYLHSQNLIHLLSNRNAHTHMVTAQD